MYSETDTGLPYGQSDTQSVHHNFFPKSRKSTSWSEGQIEIYGIKQRVIRVYRNEIVNGFPLTLNNQ